MKAAIVVPSNRPERLCLFIAAWADQFKREDVRLIICEDAPAATVALVPTWAEHYAWPQIDDRLGEKADCIPRRAGGIRSFGFWLAGMDKSIDMIVSLDDDCMPNGNENLIAAHWSMLEQPRTLRWFNTMQDETLPRGYPYGVRAGVKAVLNHGLWRGVPDVDAYTQLQEPDIRFNYVAGSLLVPVGQYLPMCIMNVAFRRDMAPYMYMPPLPEGMKRWDDIWCGVIFKRLADVYGWAVTSGEPCVRHERASNVLTNLKQEMLGYGINERMWKVVDNIVAAIVGPQSSECDGWNTSMEIYLAIATDIGIVFPELENTSLMMRRWARLWQ